MQDKAFLENYLADLARLEKTYTSACWTAANTGKDTDFAAYSEAEIALDALHSDTARYQALRALLEKPDSLDSSTQRALEVAELEFKGNQLPPALLEQMTRAAAEIEQIFNNFRGVLAGSPQSNNQLLEMLRTQKNSAQRQAAWEALKQVGTEVAPKLVALAKVRNQAAAQLGYSDYWEMEIRLQEHDPGQLVALFAELEQLTNAPFSAMKAELDAELGEKFGVRPTDLMPWHYDNPFFQAAPPSAKVNFDVFYNNKSKEDIVHISHKFYTDIGFDVEEILNTSDLYERTGKDQEAFCIDMNRYGYVRVLANVQPTADWMDTMLHELGHAIYYKLMDFSLPFNLREAAHTFTTEAVAMLFGALAKNPAWLVTYAGADPDHIQTMHSAILEQRRREQLIFARWTMVMFHFERALYGNPEQDLNGLWWGLVERLQGLRRPTQRDQPDWAAKAHFSSAPVYYHNYTLGELFAAQLRHKLAALTNQQGLSPSFDFAGYQDFGRFLTEKLFRPGMRYRWPDFVTQATGEPLTAKHFAAEVG